MSQSINIGQSESGHVVALPLKMGNRHGLVTGSTGGGKTVTLQRLAEEFSNAGVPVFAADIKGDLSGVACFGDLNDTGKARKRMESLDRAFIAKNYPVQFWDLFGHEGTPIRTSVHAMGAELMGRMLNLNEIQQGSLAIAFKKSDDEQEWMLSLDDLRMTLDDMLEHREDISRRYGNITASSINSIQRQILALEVQGGHKLFGEPPFEILDLIQTQVDGRGVIGLLSADNLMEAPKLYATFLLWLLTELFRVLPEAGDLDKPKLVFFFDEAHLLFTDAPKALVQQIERTIRLVRSKGVGVFFVTQSAADIPDTVLAQLGSRIQHSLRAYTPRDQRMVKAAAAAFRENRGVDVRKEITTLAVGEALISVLDDTGVPTKVEKVWIYPPAGQIGPISEMERGAIIGKSPLHAKYFYGLDDNAGAGMFQNRIRRSKGLQPVDLAKTWFEGDYAAFLPSEDNEERVSPAVAMKRHLGRFTLGISFLAFAWTIAQLAL